MVTVNNGPLTGRRQIETKGPAGEDGPIESIRGAIFSKERAFS